MKRKFRYAFNALEKLGCPVFENADTLGYGNFKISAEENTGDNFWADYWFDCGFISPLIIAVLRKHGLYAEWDNPGCLSVWEA